ncbi:MAG: DUF177 domain-containing protein [Acetilactobacillus jinshanensis]
MGKPVRVHKTMALSRQLVSRDSDQIFSASPVKVNGLANYNFGKVIVTAHIICSLVVPSSRSLKPVQLPLNFRFKEIYVKGKDALKLYLQEHPEGDTVLTPDQNREIDFDKSVIDNIILQIPVQVLSSKEKRDHLMPKGNGWSVVSEDQYKHPKKAGRKQVDPRLAKLKYYFSKNNKNK